MADTEQLDEDKRCTLFDGRRRFCQRCSEFHKLSDWSDGCEPYLGAAPIRACSTCGGDHPLDRWPGNCAEEPNWNRSDLASPYFISDNLESIGGLNGVQCQASGIHFTSKKKLRNEYRARGVIEIGNEKQKPFVKPAPDRKAIKEAIHRAHYAVFNEGARVENFKKQRKAHQKGAFGAVNPVAK